MNSDPGLRDACPGLFSMLPTGAIFRVMDFVGVAAVLRVILFV